MEDSCLLVKGPPWPGHFFGSYCAVSDVAVFHVPNRVIVGAHDKNPVMAAVRCLTEIA
jgi:hypothetical protein